MMAVEEVRFELQLEIVSSDAEKPVWFSLRDLHEEEYELSAGIEAVIAL